MTPERLAIETLLRIPTKDGEDVDFILNADQAKFDGEMSGRDIIAKYRQGGFSTLPLGRALIRCLGYRNRRHVIIAHNSDTTQKLLGRVHYMIKHLKGPAPDLKHSTTNRIVFNKTDSSIFIGTAGSDDYGVGDTITDLHCSEVSRWPHPESLLTGLFQAVPPSGNILIESTGKGSGNWFHQACIRSSTGVGYKLHFFPWTNTKEYMIPTSEADAAAFMTRLDETIEEPKYAALGVSAAQLRWRRMKLAELNYDLRLFKENYPVTLAECFQSTGYGVFHEINFVSHLEWRAVDPWTRVMGDHPKRERPYVAGVDVAAGVGKDYSVLEIFEAVTGEQVLEYRNNMIQPDRFAEIAVELCSRFNNAFMNPERNNHGNAFVSRLLATSYPKSCVHRPKVPKMGFAPVSELHKISDYGTYTTETMKELMIDALRVQARKELTIRSDVLNLEMGSFVEDANGRMGAEIGCFDDTVMASALAAFVRPQVVRRFLRQSEERDSERIVRGMKFEGRSVLAEFEARWSSSGGYPIGSGVEELV